MKTRCFAFGCSFTHYWIWPTWADMAGVNFDEFYNCGMSGASNFMMLRRFLEADHHMKFCAETDHVLIGLTSFGRYSFLREVNGQKFWVCRGGPDNWPGSIKDPLASDTALYLNMDFIRKNIWKIKYGIYDTWQMITSIKRLLTLSGVNHTIAMTLDNTHFLEQFPYQLDQKELDMAREIYELVDIKDSLQDFKKDFPSYFNDQHPVPEAHYAYLKKYLPQFDTDKTLNFYNEIINNFYSNNFDEQCTQTSIVLKNFTPLRNTLSSELFYGSYQ